MIGLVSFLIEVRRDYVRAIKLKEQINKIKQS